VHGALRENENQCDGCRHHEEQYRGRPGHRLAVRVQPNDHLLTLGQRVATYHMSHDGS
jgi:hypothetical protein